MSISNDPQKVITSLSSWEINFIKFFTSYFNQTFFPKLLLIKFTTPE